MNDRRSFFRRSFAGLLGLSLYPRIGSASANSLNEPIAVATWDKPEATSKAWQVLYNGGRAIDAVEQGACVAEADPNDMSVGYGGRPDRDGRVTLDASIMDDQGNCGAVCYLEDIKHPVSVARLVMDKTPHVMLAGSGAQQLALEYGHKKQDLLTPAAKAAWKRWKVKAEYEPIINIENHDTIGILALDGKGNLSGACTTSGLAFKRNGRVGDSSIIGAGLYVDNEVGGAVATGLGEAVMKTCGAFLIVELMRQGWSPTAACREALSRIAAQQKQTKQAFQVGFLAINKAGQIGAFGLRKGFSFTRCIRSETTNQEAKSYL